MKCALVVGGGGGIGLALVHHLLEEGYQKVYVADRVAPDLEQKEIEWIPFNLLNDDYSVFDHFSSIDTLIITAGFGRICTFECLTETEIVNSFKVNSVAAIRLIKRFYPQLMAKTDFSCAVMGSIAGLISSPMFSVYAATKAALCRFIESVNIELEQLGTGNRILNISPGSIKGTGFNGAAATDLDGLKDLAGEIILRMRKKETLFIPNYDEVYRRVLAEYAEDPHQFGMQSYLYKQQSGRIGAKPQVRIGYLSGTFDLFHIGHLNILKRAKQYCDYLVVGVHKDGSHKNKKTYISFEERCEIVRNIRYVDEVIPSEPEDVDVYPKIQYHYLFVGSDYQGTERFQRYESYFADKDVKIIYFPYTTGTSSSQLRAVLGQEIENTVKTPE